MHIGFQVKCSRYSCQILINLEFSRQILEKHHNYKNVIEIRPVVVELFHADIETDRHDEDSSCFRNLAEARTTVQPVLWMDSKAGSALSIPKNQPKTEALCNAT
jgi:hypothetical protein